MRECDTARLNQFGNFYEPRNGESGSFDKDCDWIKLINNWYLQLVKNECGYLCLHEGENKCNGSCLTDKKTSSILGAAMSKAKTALKRAKNTSEVQFFENMIQKILEIQKKSYELMYNYTIDPSRKTTQEMITENNKHLVNCQEGKDLDTCVYHLLADQQNYKTIIGGRTVLCNMDPRLLSEEQKKALEEYQIKIGKEFLSPSNYIGIENLTLKQKITPPNPINYFKSMLNQPNCSKQKLEEWVNYFEKELHFIRDIGWEEGDEDEKAQKEYITKIEDLLRLDDILRMPPKLHISVKKSSRRRRKERRKERSRKRRIRKRSRRAFSR